MTTQSGLRLILGLGRSGTTWLSSAIGQSESSLRFAMEGLLAFRPKIKLSTSKDRGASPYVATLDETHQLAQFYSTVAAPHFDATQQHMEGPIVRNDLDPHCAIVKEVHALLATEALVDHLKCPTVIIKRDPIRIVDSLFARDGYRSYYLDGEAEELLGEGILPQRRFSMLRTRWRRPANPELIDRYFVGQSSKLQQLAEVIKSQSSLREQTVLAKIVTVGLMSNMLTQIATESPYCRLVRYEELCERPIETVANVSDHFDIECGESVRSFLRESTSRDTQSPDRFPVYRTQQQVADRPFKFLTDLEVEVGRNLLAEISAPLLPSHLKAA